MDKIILEQVKKFIKGMSESSTMTSVRKTSFTDGYKAGLEAVMDIIKMGEAFMEPPSRKKE